MNITILDALTYGDTSLAGFDSLGDVTVYQTTTFDATGERVRDAEVIVTNKVMISDAVMENAPKLKLICVAATGMNNIDHEAAARRGISVKNVAGYSTDAVVQHTFSMLFYLMGHSRYYDEYVKSGEWQKEAVFAHIGPSFSELRGKTWGLSDWVKSVALLQTLPARSVLTFVITQPQEKMRIQILRKRR